MLTSPPRGVNPNESDSRISPYLLFDKQTQAVHSLATQPSPLTRNKAQPIRASRLLARRRWPCHAADTGPRPKTNSSFQEQDWLSNLQKSSPSFPFWNDQLLRNIAGRRVRCDETRPQCTQCTSRSRECRYEAQLPSNQVLRIEIYTSASIFESQHEHRAFSYFQQRTSEHLAGLVESDFWSRTLLQAARTDPSARHALIALAAVHEDYEGQTQGAIVRTNQFALQQYNRAIRSHVRRCESTQAMSPNDLKSYLVSCVVFICIEMLQGHAVSATSLIKQAVSLFYSLPVASIGACWSDWPRESVEVFEAILSRFQFMSVGLFGRLTSIPRVPPLFKASILQPMPDRFSSVRQAKEYLDFYLAMHELSRRPTSRGYIDDPMERDSQSRAAVAIYHDLVSRWSSAYQALKLQLGDEIASNPRTYCTFTVLDIRRILMTSMTDLSQWQNRNGPLADILDLTESILNQLNASKPFANSKQQRLFTLELGTISPLFMIARACRDPVLRRRAIHLLRKVPVREGLWDSLTAADITERIMKLEEKAAGGPVRAAGDVPEWARIPDPETVVGPGLRKMVMRYSRRGNGMVLEQPVEFEEVMEM